MDWITGIQNAINYVEEHLTEDKPAKHRKSFKSRRCFAALNRLFFVSVFMEL